MSFTIGALLIVLWLAGLITSYTLGGFIYVALVIGILLLMWAVSEDRGRGPHRLDFASEPHDNTGDGYTGTSNR